MSIPETPLVLDHPAMMMAWSRARRREGRTVGFVPTMGNLHAGHVSLLKRAAADNDVAVASVYVNPKQFGPGEDFAAYPRTFDSDVAACAAAGVAVVFAPRDETMYPHGFATSVDVAGLGEGLCGASRPGHFRGVATVVARLHGLVLPTRAYYGEKDYQQLRIITRLSADLGLGIEIVGMPIVREADGLAMSSRNQYLDPEERAAATCLYRALLAAQRLADKGKRPAMALEDAAAAVIESDPPAEIDYVSLVDPDTLVPMSALDEPGRLCLAVRFPHARLIDNALLLPGGIIEGAHGE